MVGWCSARMSVATPAQVSRGSTGEKLLTPSHPAALTTAERGSVGAEGGRTVKVLYGRCAGLDVHQKTVVACVLTSTATQEVRTFGTMTRELEALSAWLVAAQGEQVAPESTGVYWWPVFTILEEAKLAVTLVNPHHTRALPGHKTDVGDAVWLADLLRHGLVRASFIPPAEIRALRELTRYRLTRRQPGGFGQDQGRRLRADRGQGEHRSFLV